jgi:hypothetical protein
VFGLAVLVRALVTHMALLATAVALVIHLSE